MSSPCLFKGLVLILFHDPQSPLKTKRVPEACLELCPISPFQNIWPYCHQRSLNPVQVDREETSSSETKPSIPRDDNSPNLDLSPRSRVDPKLALDEIHTQNFLQNGYALRIPSAAAEVNDDHSHERNNNNGEQHSGHAAQSEHLPYQYLYAEPLPPQHFEVHPLPPPPPLHEEGQPERLSIASNHHHNEENVHVNPSHHEGAVLSVVEGDKLYAVY